MHGLCRMIAERLMRDRRAVTSLEYGLLAALIAVAIITAVTNLGTTTRTTYSSVSTRVNAVATNPNVTH